MLQLLLHQDIPTTDSCPSLTFGMSGRHNDRRKAILRSTSDVINDHSPECGKGYERYEYRLSKQGNLIVKHSRRTYDHRPGVALVSTCCTLCSGKTVPGLRRGKYRIHHSDTGSGLRRRKDCTLNMYTAQIVHRTFHIPLAPFASCCIRCR